MFNAQVVMLGIIQLFHVTKMSEKKHQAFWPVEICSLFLFPTVGILALQNKTNAPSLKNFHTKHTSLRSHQAKMQCLDITFCVFAVKVPIPFSHMCVDAASCISKRCNSFFDAARGFLRVVSGVKMPSVLFNLKGIVELKL